MDFWERDTSFQLNQLFNNDSLHSELLGKSYQCTNAVLSLLPEYVDRVTGYKEELTLEETSMLYSELAGDPCTADSWSEIWINELVAPQKHLLQDFDETVALPKNHCNSELF